MMQLRELSLSMRGKGKCVCMRVCVCSCIGVCVGWRAVSLNLLLRHIPLDHIILCGIQGHMPPPPPGPRPPT